MLKTKVEENSIVKFIHVRTQGPGYKKYKRNNIKIGDMHYIERYENPMEYPEGETWNLFLRGIPDPFPNTDFELVEHFYANKEDRLRADRYVGKYLNKVSPGSGRITRSFEKRQGVGYHKDMLPGPIITYTPEEIKNFNG